MYLGSTPQERALERARARTLNPRAPNLRDTVEQRRFEREAERIERQDARNLRRVRDTIATDAPQHSDPMIPTTAPGSAVVVPPFEAGPSQAPGGDAGGGSATVNVSPGESAGMPGWLIPVLIAGGSFLLFGM